MFCLVVDDGTGEIPLLICYDDGVKFLCGMKAVDLSKDSEALSHLTQIIRRLETSALPAVFCIKSYSIIEQATNEKAMRYRICDTFLNL